MNTAAEFGRSDRSYWSDLLLEVIHKAPMRHLSNHKSNEQVEVKKKEVAKRVYYSLGQDFKDIQFSKREADCMALMLRGIVGSKTIGRELDLSSRTVESYTANMRRKLNCATRQELITLVHRSEFLKNYLGK